VRHVGEVIQGVVAIERVHVELVYGLADYGVDPGFGEFDGLDHAVD